MSEPSARDPVRPARPPADPLTTVQRGFMVAALAAFFGVAFGGPALTRLGQRRQRVQERIAWRTRDARSRARKAGKQAKRKLKRLGGGAIWR